MLKIGRWKLYSPNLHLTRNLISLPIEWKRPAKVHFTDPWKTGDGVTKLVVDMKKSPVAVEQSAEMTSANELVKKLFTFDFLGRKFAMIRAKDEMVSTVQNHDYDSSSVEVQIARKTAIIRNLLEHMEINSKDTPARTYLHATILKRKKRLRLLREWDYRKFEWILDRLDLYYKPSPSAFDPVERKKSIRKLTDKYCEEFKNNKLREYQNQLESRRDVFLKEKLNTLKWIQMEEKECGVEPTIFESDIIHVEKQLTDHLQKMKSKPSDKGSSGNILADV